MQSVVPLAKGPIQSSRISSAFMLIPTFTTRLKRIIFFKRFHCVVALRLLLSTYVLIINTNCCSNNNEKPLLGVLFVVEKAMSIRMLLAAAAWRMMAVLTFVSEEKSFYEPFSPHYTTHTVHTTHYHLSSSHTWKTQ